MKKLTNLSEIANIKALSTEATKQVKGGAEGDWILVETGDGSREWRRRVN